MSLVRRLTQVLLLSATGLTGLWLLHRFSLETLAPVAVRIVALSLAWWWVHIAIHEGAHWLVARLVGFEILEVQWGPLRFDCLTRRFSFSRAVLSGRVLSVPRGSQPVGPLLKRVALAGPWATLMTLGVLLAFTGWPVPLGDWPGVALAMGAVVLLSAIRPGDALTGFSDLQLWWQHPKTFAFWLYECALEGARRGRRPVLTVSDDELQRAHERHGQTVAPIDLVWVVNRIEAGQHDEALAWLTRAQQPHDGPVWLKADLAMQCGCLAALHHGPEALIRECLATVEKHAALPWYPLMLRACLALREGRPDDARREFDAWQEAVQAHPQHNLLMAGNAWLVEALSARLTQS